MVKHRLCNDDMIYVMLHFKIIQSKIILQYNNIVSYDMI